MTGIKAPTRPGRPDGRHFRGATMDKALQQFDCRACGACCTTIGLPPFELPELARLPAATRTQALSWAIAADGDRTARDCRAYDRATRSCTIYAERPAKCRDFEIGGQGCLNHRRRAEIA